MQRATNFQHEAIIVKEMQLPSAMPEEDVIRSCILDADIEPPNLDTLVRHLIDPRVKDQESFHNKKCKKPDISSTNSLGLIRYIG